MSGLTDLNYRDDFHGPELLYEAVLAKWLVCWRGNSLSKGQGFNPSCDQLLSLGRGLVV